MTRSIIVCAHEPAASRLFRDVRAWVVELKERFSSQPTPFRETELKSAVERANTCSDMPAVLVCSGLRMQSILENVPQRLWPLCLAAGYQRKSSEPLATPLLDQPANVGSVERRHIEKLTALQEVMPWLKVRVLASKDEMLQFLKLRDRVWKELDYGSRRRNRDECDVEIDYSDKFSIAIGAFESVNSRERLIGGVRLVMEAIDNNPQWEIIQQIVAEKRNAAKKKRSQAAEAALVESLLRRRQHAYPFDLLASFPAFPKTYCEWVRKGRLKAEVSRVVVEPAMRKRHVGEVLIDSAIAIAKSEGLDLLFLACKGKHVSFYERCGFEPFPDLTCPSFAGVDVPAVGMIRDL